MKHVALDGNRARKRLLATRVPRRGLLWRVSGTAAGALAALLATGAGWPAAAPSGGLSQAGDPAPSGAGLGVAHQAWLLSRTAPVSILAPKAGTIAAALPTVPPLRHALPVDLVAVSARSLPGSALAAIRALHDVRAAQAADAARVQVNGRFAATLGVDPGRFRRFAAKPTAKDDAFWSSVAAGQLGVSYTMGKHDKLPVGTAVQVSGRHMENMRVGRLGTVGIAGVDAVVSDTVARSLGFPVNNVIVISAPGANYHKLAKRVGKLLPRSAVVDVMVAQPVSTDPSGSVPASVPSQPSISGLASVPQVRAMLTAALSRVGMPYVWGAAGPTSFDCSGLVKWSFAQAGIVMPRVAADQALTGPAVAVQNLQPGDLLFYHTDPTAPGYISHVAIYLGGGRMIQAPQPGQNVEVVPVDLADGFAGAVDVAPRVAAQVAATSV